ncbi:flagellar hook-basal body protein [Solidesulfovibrio carbinoliphilus subsp. oakridgensis]|uniref:Flagellar hook protein FlgE n=1 Tax=Solidesulfovibrio carbinoliphilus subsp. oakridgensis TaxID=694327 RepID=G7QBX4_9BACT|nr:flagellar hook-basal body complex protein [Solidesulfovibrio carbinoliphilus]EHJ49467.1 flagellar hook-basal body protein [Solidesulfovibrio carbinoliphilus subsp. oakridgensis]
MTAIWTGVSGMLSYSQGIANTSNNLANTNTVGYKSSRMLFADMISELAGSTTDTNSQIGMGVQVGTVSMSTGVGAIATGDQSMDMAIDGEHGYFTVKDPVSDKTYYTRAGDFNFNTDGYLVSPTGNRVQGWAVDQAAVTQAERTGSVLPEVPVTGDPTDIRITDFTLPAQATGSVSMITNLDSLTDPGILDATDPYCSMFKSYDAANTPPATAAYTSDIKVYDAEGGAHSLTVNYSKVTDTGGKEYWEYMVTVPPADDGSSVTGGTSKAGVLMIGTLTFSAQGVLENQTAFTPTGGDPTDLSSWTQAPLDSTGVPQMSATFKSVSNGSVLSSQTMGFKTGLSASGASWNPNGPSSAADIGTLAAANAGFDPSSTRNAVACTTSYATSSYTQAQSQDGFASGTLNSTSVDENGVVSGTFSNGQTKDLYVLALADFRNPTDLRREGNNLLSATTESGAATTGRANSGIYDGISGYSLESSNVDMATEMVNLITLQRAFQSNSKVVTTADTMMEKALEIKK